MQEELLRQELPIQSIRERGDACTATVPVHLKVLELDGKLRTNPSLIREARPTIINWYNEDMNYYLKVLENENIDLPWLRGYEKFNERWRLDSVPESSGFLKLIWDDLKEIRTIGFIEAPVILYNQHNEFGEFVTPAYYRERGRIEIMYRSMRDPEVVNMVPEKMRRYGVENELASINEERGVAQVCANAFCSDYHDNMAKTLLLRDFAVFYLNRLLIVAQDSS